MSSNHSDDRDVKEATFAELFEASMQKAPPREPQVGEEVEGILLGIGQEYCFIDVGAKGEALIATSELLDPDGVPEVAVGERISARVVRRGPEGLVLSRVLQGGAAGGRMLEDAKEFQIPVEGLVKAVVKGGLEVEVGGVRCFCPASQADLHYVEDLTVLVEEKLAFRVIEIRDGGKSVVLSRKALLSEERDRRAAVTREHLAVGAVFRGVVSSVRDFGAFVDIGGIEGLLHISEIAHGRVERVADVLSAGQEVEVAVKKIEGDRLSLSMKSLAGDPWSDAATRFVEGSRHTGVITRIQPFGAFVELTPGVDGLLHVSTLDDPRITDARRAFSEGDTVDVVVVSFDSSKQRIGLAPASRRQAEPGDLSPGALVTGVVDRVEHYGVFLRLPGDDGRGRAPRGLLPREEIRNAPEDLKRSFPVGAEVRVLVLPPDDQGRMRLSQRAVEEAQERQDAAPFMQKGKDSGGLGTFADLLSRSADSKKPR